MSYDNSSNNSDRGLVAAVARFRERHPILFVLIAIFLVWEIVSRVVIYPVYTMLSQPAEVHKATAIMPSENYIPVEERIAQAEADAKATNAAANAANAEPAPDPTPAEPAPTEPAPAEPAPADPV